MVWDWSKHIKDNSFLCDRVSMERNFKMFLYGDKNKQKIREDNAVLGLSDFD